VETKFLRQLRKTLDQNNRGAMASRWRQNRHIMDQQAVRD
jgi:hypothetical protein